MISARDRFFKKKFLLRNNLLSRGCSDDLPDGDEEGDSKTSVGSRKKEHG